MQRRNHGERYKADVGDRGHSLGLLAWPHPPPAPHRDTWPGLMGGHTPGKAPPHPQAETRCRGEVFKASQDTESFFYYYFLEDCAKGICPRPSRGNKEGRTSFPLSVSPTLAKSQGEHIHPTASSSSHSREEWDPMGT